MFPCMELIQILGVCCISNEPFTIFLWEGYAQYLKKNRLLVISWINDCSRIGKFFCQAGKQYSHYSNQLISCMCIVYKMNYSQFLLGRGILNIFGQNGILHFSVNLRIWDFCRARKQCSHIWNCFKFWVSVVYPMNHSQFFFGRGMPNI